MTTTNAMLTAFLDDARCLALAQRLCPERYFGPGGEETALVEPDEIPVLDQYRQHAELTTSASSAHATFGHKGWDAVVVASGPALAVAPTSLPECACGPSGHAPRRSRRWQVYREDSHRPDCSWSFEGGAARALGEVDHGKGRWRAGRTFEAFSPLTILVSLRVGLFDSFPDVLRRVVRYPHARGQLRCVIVGYHLFEPDGYGERVAWTQVVEMFARSGVTLIEEAELVEQDR